MNIFTEHPHKQGRSYFEHMVFALNIAIRLLGSVIALTLHGLFPFFDINKSLDLEETARFINQQNNWIEGMKIRQQADSMQLHLLQK